MKLKDFITKAQFRTYINDRLFNGKIKKISTFKKDYIIFEVKLNENEMVFNVSNCRIQSVSLRNKTAVYTLSNVDYKRIISEIDYFRRFPGNAKKQGFNII